jgi:peptide-methionine (R)-S-oxide reductase
MVKKVVKSDQEWRRQLTPEQYEVARRGGTEPAFSGKYYNLKDKGVYRCVCCGNLLSGEAVETSPDDSLGMTRTEVRCARCDAHLGHVFDDGPLPEGQRYCMNSIVLDFNEDENKQE